MILPPLQDRQDNLLTLTGKGKMYPPVPNLSCFWYQSGQRINPYRHRIILAFLGGLFMSGCTPLSAMLPITDAFNKAADDQFLTDKWISEWYGKPCSLKHFIQHNVMCQDNPPNKVVAPIYCYRTLGHPQCFQSPDPFNPDRQILGGLPQQQRQAEHYRQYQMTGTRTPLTPAQSMTPSPLSPPEMTRGNSPLPASEPQSEPASEMTETTAPDSPASPDRMTPATRASSSSTPPSLPDETNQQEKTANRPEPASEMTETTAPDSTASPDTPPP